MIHIYTKMDDKRGNLKQQVKKRKKKVVLVFDENARREFLTGFHKRKVQRKAKAAEQLQKQLQIEKKKIKAGAKVAYRNLLQTKAVVPKVEDLQTQEIDMGLHSVTITEISPSALAKEYNWIGVNQVEYEDNCSKSVKNSNGNGTVNKCKNIEGMEIHSDCKNEDNYKSQKLKTCKDLKKAIKREATNQVKRNKAFRTQSKVCQIKNAKKRSREDRRRNIKRTKKKK